MPHFPKPYFRSARGVWYVQVAGKEITLGRDKTAAFQAYHVLMSNRPTTRASTAAESGAATIANAPAFPVETTSARDPVGDPFVIVLIDDFLGWCKANQAPDTYRWYRDRLNSFCNSVPAALTVSALKPFHVQKWVDVRAEGLASGSRRNFVASVKRAMSWGEEQGYIVRSPIAKMKKPGCGRKEQVVTPEQYKALLEWSSDEAFRDLLTVAWETGCRPQEVLRVEAQHVDLQKDRWVFPTADSKGKRRPRVVYLTPLSRDICLRLTRQNPTGPIFRNAKGGRWTPYAVNCRFCRAQKTLGVKVSLYALRHTWINGKLTAGVDAFTVAVLAGHSDPSMLAKHYAHLSQAPGYLAEQARRTAI